MGFISPARGFDPERFAHRLAPLGVVLALAGGWAGDATGLVLVASGFALLLLACTSRVDGLLVLGPFVRAELTRAARASRPWLRRAVFAAVLTANVYTFAPEALSFHASDVSGQKMATAAAMMVVWFMLILFGYVSLLTVQLIAPVVAEEREAKRWELLLTTDLRGREILIGRVVGRLAVVLDPVLVSAPVLAVIPLLGGVSPRLVAGLVGALLATVAGLTGVSMYATVSARTARQATRRAVGLVLAYLLGTGMLQGLQRLPAVWSFPSPPNTRTTSFVVGDAVEWVSRGNPFVAGAGLAKTAVGGTANLESQFLAAVGGYAAFQVGVLAVLGLVAMGRVRRSAHKPRRRIPEFERAGDVRPTSLAADSDGVRGVVAPGSPNANKRRTGRPIGNWPVYRWERFGEARRRRGWSAWLLSWKGLMVVGGIGYMTLVLFEAVETGRLNRVGFLGLWSARLCEVGLKVGLWFSTWSFLFGPMFQAARSVSRERASDTLEGLQLTALSGRDILVQKWAACVMYRWPLYRLVVTVAVEATVAGLIHPVTLCGLAILVPVYAAAGAALGLLFSVRTKRPGQAVSGAVAGSILVTLAVAQLVIQVYGRTDRGEAVGLATAPPVALGLVVWHHDGRSFLGWLSTDFTPGVFASPVIFAAVGGLAWWAALVLFNRDGPLQSAGPAGVPPVTSSSHRRPAPVIPL